MNARNLWRAAASREFFVRFAIAQVIVPIMTAVVEQRYATVATMLAVPVFLAGVLGPIPAKGSRVPFVTVLLLPIANYSAVRFISIPLQIGLIALLNLGIGACLALAFEDTSIDTSGCRD